MLILCFNVMKNKQSQEVIEKESRNLVQQYISHNARDVGLNPDPTLIELSDQNKKYLITLHTNHQAIFGFAFHSKTFCLFCVLKRQRQMN